MKTIVLTGGGTGGHVIPHLSLIDLIRKDFDKIVYIGRDNSIEKEIISTQKDIEFKIIPATKFKRNVFFKNFLIPFKLLKSIAQSKKILKKTKPLVVFSKGGFVSVPVCIAAKLLKIPVVSHESDLTLGLANKIIYKFCNIFCTTFETTAQGLKKAVYTGSPVRQNLTKGDKEKGYKLANIDKSRPTLLIMGGSTGALALNQKVYLSLKTLLTSYNVIHLVGKSKGDLTKVFKNYCQIEYCNNIEDLFAICDFVISRAGSNAIYEFLTLKKPMLLIPLPKDASRGDQLENARYFVKKGYARMLLQKDLTKENLVKEINELQKNKNAYIKCMQDADKKKGREEIYKQIKKYI